jgi:hypothetical protein
MIHVIISFFSLEEAVVGREATVVENILHLVVILDIIIVIE